MRGIVKGDDTTSKQFRESRCLSLFGQQHGDIRFCDDVSDPVIGMGRIDRDVGGARLKTPQDRDDRQLRPRKSNPHKEARACPNVSQAMGQSISAELELAIGQCGVPADEGNRITASVGLPFEQLMQAIGLRSREGCCGSLPARTSRGTVYLENCHC